MRKTLLVLIVAAWAAFHLRPGRAAVGADGPVMQPGRTYRLVLREYTDGDQFKQLFVLLTPEGEPLLSSHAELTRTIDRIVDAPATLRWEPSGTKVDREPLDDAAERKALADFCAKRQIQFVVVPAG